MPAKNAIVEGRRYAHARMQKRASLSVALLVACAVLGLHFSAGQTVAGNVRGAVAVIGQVGAELPPGGVRSFGWLGKASQWCPPDK